MALPTQWDGQSTYHCAIMKIRIAKYVYVHIQPQALGPQWGQQENEEMTDRHRTHTQKQGFVYRNL